MLAYVFIAHGPLLSGKILTMSPSAGSHHAHISHWCPCFWQGRHVKTGQLAAIKVMDVTEVWSSVCSPTTEESRLLESLWVKFGSFKFTLIHTQLFIVLIFQQTNRIIDTKLPCEKRPDDINKFNCGEDMLKTFSSEMILLEICTGVLSV